MTVTGNHFTRIRMGIEDLACRPTAYAKVNAGTSAPTEDRDMVFPMPRIDFR